MCGRKGFEAMVTIGKNILDELGPGERAQEQGIIGQENCLGLSQTEKVEKINQ